MKFLDRYIDEDMQRKIGYIILGALALSYVWFLSPAFWWMRFSIWGAIDIGTVMGAIGAVFVWNFYKRWL